MDTRKIAKEYRLRHWAGIMQERIASGSSIKAYCQTAGICENVYYYWQRKLREAACEEFLPSVIGKDDEAIVPSGWSVCEESKVDTPESIVSIEIGRSRIVVGGDVSADQLEKVCRVLMRLC